MFDDLRRNFVMNPRNGLTIRPFRKAHLNKSTDDELARLTQYLFAIADLADISKVDHRYWESYVEVGFTRQVPVESVDQCSSSESSDKEEEDGSKRHRQRSVIESIH